MNKVILLGRITKDTELKSVGQNNTSVSNFTLAINKKFKKEGEPDAEFINCQAWGKTAETLVKYCEKGSQICVVGRLQVRKWVDNDGKTKYSIEVVVEEFYFAGTKRTKSSDSDDSNFITENDIDTNEDELPF